VDELIYQFQVQKWWKLMESGLRRQERQAFSLLSPRCRLKAIAKMMGAKKEMMVTSGKTNMNVRRRVAAKNMRRIFIRLLVRKLGRFRGDS
jgi:hypothetical protein